MILNFTKSQLEAAAENLMQSGANLERQGLMGEPDSEHKPAKLRKLVRNKVLQRNRVTIILRRR
jgi:hypothetical protein